MNVKIGTETPIFLFWEHLFRNFGFLSLQCVKRYLNSVTCKENDNYSAYVHSCTLQPCIIQLLHVPTLLKIYKDKDYSLPLPPPLPVAVTDSNVQQQQYTVKKC